MEADITPVAETNGTTGISPEHREGGQENAQGIPEQQQQESVKSLDGGVAGAVGGIIDYLEVEASAAGTTGNQGTEAEYLDEEMPGEEEKQAEGLGGPEEAEKAKTGAQEASNNEELEPTAAADGGDVQSKAGEDGEKEAEDGEVAEDKDGEGVAEGEAEKETTKKGAEVAAGEEGDGDEAAKGEDALEADKDEEDATLEGEDGAADEAEEGDDEGEEADEEDEDGMEDPTEEGEEVLEPEATDEEGELITGDEPGELADGDAAPSRERKKEEVVDENQCRVCTSKEDLVCLFKKQIDATPADMLLVICPSVSILPKDFMPQFICTKCLTSLTIAIQLRKQLETTDQDLRKRLSRSKNKVRRPRGYVVIDAPVTDSSEDEEELDDEFKVSDVGGSTSADSDSVDSDASEQKKEKKKPGRPGRPRKTPLKRSNEDDDDESPSVPKKKYTTTPTASVGPFECEHCDLTFSRKQSYVLHRKTHERTEHTCPICGKKFKVEWAYKTHMERHEQERAQFRCELCSQVFRLRAELKRHMAVKHDEHGFIYECKRCQRTFLTSQRLQRHQAIGCQRPREEVRIKEEPRIKMEPRMRDEPRISHSHSHGHGHGNHGKRRPGEGRDLFKAVAPPTTTYWSDSFSD